MAPPTREVQDEQSQGGASSLPPSSPPRPFTSDAEDEDLISDGDVPDAETEPEDEEGEDLFGENMMECGGSRHPLSHVGSRLT